MLLILLSWLYILTVTSVAGVSINRVLGIKSTHSAITLCIGFFGISLVTGFWAIAFPVNGYYHLSLLLITLLFIVLNKSFIIDYYNLLKVEFRQLSGFIKLLFLSLFILILAQCASPPFIIDNESYYIQTIKWLNEFGFVKGLTNLHLFLGQTSGWHILQSAFNFSFIYDRFNDLSGLILLLGNYYALTQISYNTNKKSQLGAVICLFPLLNVFFFQFISAPSPDMPIYILALIVFHQFITCYSNFTKDRFIILVLLCLFMTFIKLTALPFCLLPLIIYITQFKQAEITSKYIGIISGLTIALIITKNSIITGNALFPLVGLDIFKASWHVPESVESYFSLYGQAYGYNMSPENFTDMPWTLRFKSWFFAPGMHGIFNMTMIILLVIMPFVIKKLYNNRAYWLVYFLSIISMLIFFIISPQYRFFFPFMMIFGLMIVALLIFHKKTFHVLLVVSTIVAAIPLFFTVNNQQLTANKYHAVSSQFSLDYLIEPFKNSRYPTDYKPIKQGNTILNTPTNVDFFWGTGNIPLPAINQEQLDYFKTYFKIVPQQQTEDLKDGFYSEKFLLEKN